MRTLITPSFLWALVCLLTTSALAERIVLLEAGSEWRYLDDASDQGTAWREVGFDDSAWGSGPAPLGVANSGINTVLEREVLTVYFRTEFELPEEILSAMTKFEIDLRRDDGAVVYLNGIEIRRDNLPEGEITSATEATTAVAGNDENLFFTSTHLPVHLVAGTNTLAVEIHNTSATSSDHTMDLRLTSDDTEGFFGRSRPPCSIDFETLEHPLGFRSAGLNRSLDPTYMGLEYSYDAALGLGNAFLSSREILEGATLDSKALAAIDTNLSFETLLIDLRNYTDVRVSLDMMTAGNLERVQNQITASLEVVRNMFDAPETIDWISIKAPMAPNLTATPTFPENAPVRYQVPTDPQIPIAEWIATDFDDSLWSESTLGIGYERSSTYLPYLGEDLESEIYNVNTSINFRVPFTLTELDLEDLEELILEMRYDDGFVAWLNGVEIARRNAPAELAWNSMATGTNDDTRAVIYERIPLTNQPPVNVGTNVLAIRGLNRGLTGSDMLIQPQLYLAKIVESEVEDLNSFKGEFKTLQTEPGQIPDDASSMVIHIQANRGGDGVAYYFDNIEVTGNPIEPDSFSTAIQLAGIDPDTNPDPEADGIGVLLEYAFGGDFFQADEQSMLLPQVSYDELGFMSVRFRMLEGYTIGNAERGYDVADLHYTPQLSTDLVTWKDGSGVPPFEEIGEAIANGDGTVTVSLRSRRRLQAEGEQAFFRLHVEVARPPGVVLAP